MESFVLGRTGLTISRSGFGALPIQRISKEIASRILRKAVENGINFIDTARAYSDSEEKIGYALCNLRKSIVIATKTGATNRLGVLESVEISLQKLKTDYIDILQLHNPSCYPDPSDPEGAVEGLLEAQRKGMVRFIGLTNHSLDIAKKAALSGIYDTIEFPLNHLSTEQELAGKFCRGCGYCMPCPVGIQINWAARMSLLLRRAPYQTFITEEWREKMGTIKDCLNCGKCRSKCPYSLDTPNLLRKNMVDYEQFVADVKKDAS